MESVVAEIEALQEFERYGRVVSIQGLLIEAVGLQSVVSIGSRCRIVSRSRGEVACEVIGFRDDRALLMPFGSLEGVGVGCKAIIAEHDAVAYPDVSWLGRVVNAMGQPLDGGPPLMRGGVAYRLHAEPAPAASRRRVGTKIDLGVRSINAFLTCCLGQRMGIFSGSGIGKSVLLSMMAKYTDSDVNVIGLIGERGREVQEFIEDDLGPEGLARSVIVVSTSDESALMRRTGAQLTLTLAEYFRDLDKHVLCLIDSITRFAMAQRDIGLSGGEPPTSKGYTPTVFAELPKLLERAGPGTGEGTITGLFTVLVEGDDHNEPVSDAVRGILDGHIVLERSIAERGRYPPVNVLRSISRSMPNCNSEEENRLIGRARGMVSIYEDMAELIRIGAYRDGTDPRVDEAIEHRDAIEAFLAQDRHEGSDLASGYGELMEIVQDVLD